MQFADLALGKSEEADIGVPQPLVDRGNVFLITTDAI
jgi:hypothetical protein